MNPLYGMLNGQQKQPTEAAPNPQVNNQPPMNWNAALGQIKANPAGMLKQAGYNVPDGMSNDPRGIVMHLIQSGQVGGPMMRMIQPMLARLGVK